MAACRRCGVAPPVSIQNECVVLLRPCGLFGAVLTSVASASLSFSLLDRRFESELAEACSDANHNLGLLAYGALCGGTLSGKGLVEGSRHKLFPTFQSRYHCEASRAAAARYAEIARAAGMSPATLALAWAFSRFFMASVIIGATTLEQLTENIKAADVVLSKEVFSQIDAVHAEIRNPNLRN